ncbi:MAG: Dihydrolipoyllysine-residue acetyltransferase component of pyruvate dehydrogenase complex [Flavobacteriaceae bacterium]|jgi:pyruvate dehydrogenase E2 component (dihydrolipoamide acetyltransferase)|nr:MAG: Dihydrolipoyllysine-residue acetyltransferase component of pyruvate dehydrogenase complex [Flavobacteriaceae bacterium]
MAEVVTMPRLSDTMEEGTVAKWLKKVGDKVEEGEILAEIETDKATMEFESFYNGTLLHIGIPEGDGAPVDSLLAIIGDEGEDISALLGGEAAPAAAPTEEVKPVEATPAPANETKAVAAIPAGVEIVTMPRLSDTMEEGTVASWLKKVGDTVEEGDILAEIETDKATMEFESFYTGTLLHIGIDEGGSAPVDSVLAIIGPAGTDVSAVLSGAAAPAPAAPVASKEAVEVKSEAPAAAPASVAPAAPVTDVTSSNTRIFASPLAKKLAKEKGLDLSTIKGSGEHGRIIRRDVEQAQVVAAPVASAKVQPVAAPVVTASGVENKESVKNSQMRKVIAKRLSESKFTAPHYYLTVEVEMDEAKAARQQINQLPDTKVSFNDMVLKASAMALLKHKQVNTTWSDEATIINHHVHLGVAVAVEDGLVVPVIKHADQLSFTQLGATVKDMAGRARNKKLTPAEMEGSTFTVSNLGMFGIEEFTSIINQPNSAILSVGAIVEKAVVRDGAIVPRSMMKLTLACDHRTIDGATGAQFLQTLKTYLEHPVTLLA